jgi:hypothetical protein
MDEAESCKRSESYTYTETDKDGVEHERTGTHHCTNPGGSSGSNGRDGVSPTHLLHTGSAGANGTASITVEHSDGTNNTFSKRYYLTVQDFEVFDENEDGINEPGEHIVVKNIVVCNTGKCPRLFKIMQDLIIILYRPNAIAKRITFKSCH